MLAEYRGDTSSDPSYRTNFVSDESVVENAQYTSRLVTELGTAIVGISNAALRSDASLMIFLDRGARGIKKSFEAFAGDISADSERNLSLGAIGRRLVSVKTASLEVHRDTLIPDPESSSGREVAGRIREHCEVDHPPSSILVVDDFTQGYFETIQKAGQLLRMAFPGAKVAAIPALDTIPFWSFEGMQFPGLQDRQPPGRDISDFENLATSAFSYPEHLDNAPQAAYAEDFMAAFGELGEAVARVVRVRQIDRSFGAAG